MTQKLLILAVATVAAATAQTVPPLRAGKLPPGAAKRVAARKTDRRKAADAPAGAQCISGPVYSIVFSAQYITQDFADYVQIGDLYICATCDIKPPIYAALTKKLETAYDTGTPVDACYDSDGYVNVIRIHSAPPASSN